MRQQAIICITFLRRSVIMPEVLAMESCSDLCGHGIGNHLHEDPADPEFPSRRRRGIILVPPGMTLAIEPMVTDGHLRKYVWLDDDWTVITEDHGGWAAHYENTILITENEPEILSL